MTNRLVNADRDLIRKKLLKYKFEKKADWILDEIAEIAEEIYNDVFSEEERELMAKLPNNWLEKSDYIQVKFGERYSSPRFSGQDYCCPLRHITERRDEISKPMPMLNSNCKKQYSAKHKLSIKYEKLMQKKDDFVAEVKKAERVAEAILKSTTTISALKKKWPEIAPFLPKVEKVKTQLPDFPVEKYNKMFGLPVPKRKAS